jgi:hypothetical protein
MINVRRNVFETNSSSTHCLALNREQTYEIHEDLFLKDYLIKAWSENNEPPYSSGKFELELKSIEDKLTYFLTMYYQSWYDDNGKEFLQKLQKLFPNTIFVLKCDDSGNYILEDGEYLFDEDEVVKLESLTDNQLKAFMEYGTIYFGNRDDESYSDFLDYELNNKHIIVKFSG